MQLHGSVLSKCPLPVCGIQTREERRGGPSSHSHTQCTIFHLSYTSSIVTPPESEKLKGNWRKSRKVPKTRVRGADPGGPGTAIEGEKSMTDCIPDLISFGLSPILDILRFWIVHKIQLVFTMHCFVFFCLNLVIQNI